MKEGLNFFKNFNDDETAINTLRHGHWECAEALQLKAVSLPEGELKTSLLSIAQEIQDFIEANKDYYDRIAGLESLIEE